MNRADAYAIVEQYVSNENLIRHMLAVEAAMRFYERCGLRRNASDCIFEIDGGDFDRLGATS